MLQGEWLVHRVGFDLGPDRLQRLNATRQRKAVVLDNAVKLGQQRCGSFVG
jgi:hypothetical protein